MNGNGNGKKKRRKRIIYGVIATVLVLGIAGQDDDHEVAPLPDDPLAGGVAPLPVGGDNREPLGKARRYFLGDETAPRTFADDAAKVRPSSRVRSQDQVGAAQVTPNPSVNATANGMAPGPRSTVAYHVLRGPGAMPSSARYLKR